MLYLLPLVISIAAVLTACGKDEQAAGKGARRAAACRRPTSAS
ncbi:hypothetical protein ACQ86G_10415 [Roseateles chitinivorans]